MTGAGVRGVCVTGDGVRGVWVTGDEVVGVCVTGAGVVAAAGCEVIGELVASVGLGVVLELKLKLMGTWTISTAHHIYPRRHKPAAVDTLMKKVSGLS